MKRVHMNAPATIDSRVRAFPWRAYLVTCVVASVWINVSEVFRYFMFVMPMTRETLAALPGVAPMSLPVFAAWGLWDTILVAIAVLIGWLYQERFGFGLKSVLAAGTICWAFLFLLFWIAMLNMNLAAPRTLSIALPLAWFEMVVTAGITQTCFRRWYR